MRPRTHVPMLGTGLATRGGVSSVARAYLDNGRLAHWDVAYLATHGSGSFVRKLCMMAAALALLGAERTSCTTA